MGWLSFPRAEKLVLQEERPSLPNYPFMGWLIVLGFIVPAGFAAYLAGEKNRNPILWGFLGLVFGVVGLIAIAGLPVDEGEDAWTNRREPKVPPEAKAWNPALGPPPE